MLLSAAEVIKFLYNPFVGGFFFFLLGKRTPQREATDTDGICGP